ncbi:hypothetical protein ACN6LI_003340 [Streptomyces violaceoruber]
MHRIRPHLRLALSILAGGIVGTANFLAWDRALTGLVPLWALLLIAGGTGLLLLSVAADVHRRFQSRGRVRRRHARPHRTGRTSS